MIESGIAISSLNYDNLHLNNRNIPIAVQIDSLNNHLPIAESRSITDTIFPNQFRKKIVINITHFVLITFLTVIMMKYYVSGYTSMEDNEDISYTFLAYYTIIGLYVNILNLINIFTDINNLKFSKIKYHITYIINLFNGIVLLFISNSIDDKKIYIPLFIHTGYLVSEVTKVI